MRFHCYDEASIGWVEMVVLGSYVSKKRLNSCVCLNVLHSLSSSQVNLEKGCQRWRASIEILVQDTLSNHDNLSLVEPFTTCKMRQKYRTKMIGVLWIADLTYYVFPVFHNITIVNCHTSNPSLCLSNLNIVIIKRVNWYEYSIDKANLSLLQ